MKTFQYQYKFAQKESIACDCCGSRQLQTIFTKDRYKMGIQTVICCQCALVFTNPVLSDRELTDFYSMYYRNYYVSTEYPDEAYIQRRNLYERAEILLEHVKPYLPDQLKLLDVGASEGTVLNTVRNYCLNSSKRKTPFLKGIEPNKKFAEYAMDRHDLEIFNGMISEFFDSNTDHFNFIILNHVLEHFKSPYTVLKQLRDILEPDGYVFIEVPNLEYNKLDLSFFHIAHIFHFTPYTLEQLALKAGFIPVYKNLSSSTIHPWAMAYIFQKIDRHNLSFDATHSYIRFITSHVRKVYFSIWIKKATYPLTFVKKSMQRLMDMVR